MLLAGPAFLLFVLLTAPALLKNWKFWLKALGFFGLGLSIYLYLPVRASMNPVLNWGNPSTWEGFWNHVTRKLYSSGSVDALLRLQDAPAKNAPEVFSSWWFDDVSRYHVWQMFLYVMQHFIEDYVWGLLVFVPFGFWWLWRKARAYGWLLLTLCVFYSFVLSKLLGLGYAGRLPVDLFKDRPFYIVILTLLCFLSVIGLNGFGERF